MQQRALGLDVAELHTAQAEAGHQTHSRAPLRVRDGLEQAGNLVILDRHGGRLASGFLAHQIGEVGRGHPAAVGGAVLHPETQQLAGVLDAGLTAAGAGVPAVGIHQGLQQLLAGGRPRLGGHGGDHLGHHRGVHAAPGALLHLAAAEFLGLEALGHGGPADGAGFLDTLAGGEQLVGLPWAVALGHQLLDPRSRGEQGCLTGAGPGQGGHHGAAGPVIEADAQLDVAADLSHGPPLAVLAVQAGAEGLHPRRGFAGFCCCHQISSSSKDVAVCSSSSCSA